MKRRTRGHILKGIVKIFPLLFMGTILYGCPRDWYLTITDTQDPARPHFCISRFSGCRGEGMGFSLLDIDEVNEEGEFIRSMWGIRPIINTALKSVIYGTPPEGYQETMKAEHLEIGKWYRVHGRVFFRIVKSDNQVRAEVYDYSDFSDKFKSK